MSEAKPRWVLALFLVLVAILSVMAIGLVMAFGGTLGFLTSVAAAMLGSTVPEQVGVISWGVAALGMTVLAGAIIVGVIAVVTGVFVAVLRSTPRGN